VLKADLSDRKCVCFKTEVLREYEEERWETDSKGNRQRRTHRGSETVSSNEVVHPFWVRDPTGAVLVDPQGADIDWEKSVEKFKRGEPDGATLTLGSFSINIGGVALSGGRRTIGYRYKEWLLPADRSVYVLGALTLCDGGPCISKPGEKGQKFILSTKSEEEIVKHAGRAIFWLTVCCGVAFLAGIVLVVVGLTKGSGGM